MTEQIQQALEQVNNSELLSLLSRIANAIELLAQSGRPVAPNYTRPIEDYVSFDWSTINAHVIRADQDGATHVEWGGETWTRRSPSNKFEPAVWYSRASGRDDDGNVLYLRLVTFKELKDSDPLPANVQKNLTRPAKVKEKGVSAETAASHPEGPAIPASTNEPTRNSVSTETPPQGSHEAVPAGDAGQAGATRVNQGRRPEEVKEGVQKMGANLAASGKSATQEQVGLIASVLEGIFKDQEDQVGSRRKVLKFLTGNDSLKTIPEHMLLSVYMWIKPYKDPASGKWHAGLLADQEACAILQEV
jgi:hypothetical protein